MWFVLFVVLTVIQLAATSPGEKYRTTLIAIPLVFMILHGIRLLVEVLVFLRPYAMGVK